MSYIENNFFHIETNSYLQVGDIIELDSHPLEDIMPSKKVYVAKFYDRNLYYNRRFAYDLEFIYIDNDFFSSSNRNWLLYKELKNNPTKLASLNPIEEADILSDMDERKKCFAPIRSKIDNWLASRVDQIVPKKLKVLIYDSSLSVFRELNGEPFKFHYTLNLQTKVMPDAYQVKRSMPHLIAYNFDEINNWDSLKKIIKSIQELEDYEPPIIVFGTNENELDKQNIKYPKLMAYNHMIRIKEVEKMAKLIDEKIFVSNAKSKVFTTSQDDNSIISMKRVVDILAMTESVAYFSSPVEIPMWTVFQLEKPVRMIFTVIPHKESGEFAREKNVYRALINGINEAEKSKLRQLINKTLAPTSEEKS